MFLRFTYLHFDAQKQSEAKSVYNNEVAPAIRKQKGNKEVLLLEPTDGGTEFISYSLWEDEAALKAFEANAEYPPIIARIKELASQPPVQKYYLVNS